MSETREDVTAVLVEYETAADYDSEVTLDLMAQEIARLRHLARGVQAVEAWLLADEYRRLTPDVEERTLCAEDYGALGDATLAVASDLPALGHALLKAGRVTL